MKNYIFLFLALSFIVFGLYGFYAYLVEGYDDKLVAVILLPLGLVFLFYLWKNNFFHRNK